MALVLEFSSAATGFKSSVVILVSLILLALPISYSSILWNNRTRLDYEKIRAKIGSLYLGIRVNETQKYLQSVIFLIRRIVYVGILILLENMQVIFSLVLV